ncbi:MAG: hypothetical protein ABSE70_06035 [Candidatus Limnocylindrales bacterium]
MFELLLRADRALADGLLDQAEATYWELIEIDPTNAIAVAGLALVSLERGDERLARTFADRAMALDPENVVAGRVVETLEHRGAERVEAELPDLPLMAAERLEALSRRRSTGPPEPAEGGEPRPGLPPGLVSELPSEPLKDRRQAGRLAAAAAAAAAAAMPPAHRTATRREPHRAMPSGNRRFDADELRAPTQDAFAVAESAAAVEAVDAAELAEETPESAPGRVSGVADVTAAVELEAAESEAAGTTEAEAATADESVAVRITLVAEAAEREAAELAAAWAREGEARRILEIAEADAADPRAHDFQAAEGAAAAEAADAADDEVAEVVAGKPRAEEFEAAEAEAARLAPNEILAAQSAEPDERVEPAARRRPSFDRSAEQPSEEDAETAALREALAIVLGTEGEAGPAEPGEATGAAPPTPTHAERPGESAAQGEPAEPTQPTPQAEPEPSASRRRRGLFRRFGGS